MFENKKLVSNEQLPLEPVRLLSIRPSNCVFHFSKGINKTEVVIKFNRTFHQLLKLLKLRCQIVVTQFTFKYTNYEIRFFLIFHQAQQIMKFNLENS